MQEILAMLFEKLIAGAAAEAVPKIEQAFADVFAAHPELGPPPTASERSAIDADFDRQLANEAAAAAAKG